MEMPSGAPLPILRSTLLRFICLTPLLLAQPLTWGGSLERQRDDFQQAEQALAKGRMSEFRALKDQLADYPLLPYLEYAELRRTLGAAEPARVQRFLEQRADTPLASRLRSAWLDHLAERRRWKTYLDFFQPSKSTTQRCHYLQALIATGHRDIAYSQVEQIWLVGRSQPKACDPVFDTWRETGQLTPELTWQRFALAMDEGQTGLARYLIRYLPMEDRNWAQNWLRIRNNPNLVLDAKAMSPWHARRGMILLYGLERMARKEPDRAERAWRTLDERYRFSDGQKVLAGRILARAFIRHHHPGTLALLDQVEPGDDLSLHHKRILTALTNEDWERALFWIDDLPEQERLNERWRYWKGRALLKLGRHEDGLALLGEVARDRTYYAFLAADHIGETYYLVHKPLVVDPARRAELEAMPAMARLHELRALARELDIKREWWWLTRKRNLDDETLQAAALVAKSWGWHDQAIFTLARSGYWDDLELRFPLNHLSLLERNASRNGIELPWVLAVVRQESAFGQRAHSPAGARGLMQLMPATAKDVARRIGKPNPQRNDLYRPETNIPLGTAYLSQVYDKLDRHPVLATAAYNAGPHRVQRWLPDRTMEADIWVETIPFQETRQYVKRVMAYAVIYEKRLGLKPGSIVQRMRPIRGSLDASVTSDAAPRNAVREGVSG
jgi:soluble lytic murein transglycosylase